MTQEQFDRGKYLEEEIRYIRAKLKAVEKFIKDYKETSVYGLKTEQQLLVDEYLYPNDNEINVMLTLMKNRYEKHITELEKEFAEL